MVIIAQTKRIPSALGGQGVLLSKLSHDERDDGSLPSIHVGCCCGGALPLQPITDWRLRALSSFTRGPIGAPYSSLPSGKGGGLTAFTHDNPRVQSAPSAGGVMASMTGQKREPVAT
jgi:hypothetical protein